MFHVIEQHGDNNDQGLQNLLFHGENIDVMTYLLDHGWKNQFKLIYCDPPFFSGTSYRYQQQSEATQVDLLAYDDKWSGGMAKYLDYFRDRLQLMRDLLSPEGSLWFHVGLRASHHVKLLLDEIFGEQNWINQIIWKKTNSPKAQSRSFGNQYDIILVHAKNKDDFKLNPVYKKPTAEYLKSFSKNDGDGRGPYQTVALMAGGLQKPAGRKVFEFRGVKAAWLYSKEKLEQFWQDGRIYKTKSGKYRLKVYLKDIPGQPISDLWTDKEVAPIQGASSEYVGFQTQKPKSLLRRIILAASREGDLVGDFFVGSGTTAVVAQELKRHWIASDVSSVAIHLTRKRLLTTSVITPRKVLKKDIEEKIENTARFTIMESQVTREDVMQSLDALLEFVAETSERNLFSLYYWKNGKFHYFLDEKKCLHRGIDLTQLLHEVLISRHLSGAPVINVLTHIREFRPIEEIQTILTRKGIVPNFWCVSALTLKNRRILAMINDRKGKAKKRNRMKKYLNDPLKPWQLPRVELTARLNDATLVLSFSKYEIPTIQARSIISFPTDQQNPLFHLIYCAIELFPREDCPFRPHYVFFSSKKQPVNWNYLQVDLSPHQKKSESDGANDLLEQGQLKFRLQCIDLLGRSMTDTLEVKAQSSLCLRMGVWPDRHSQ